MEWKTMYKREAARLAEQWESLTKTDLYRKVRDRDLNSGGLSPDCQELRDELLEAWKDVRIEVQNLENDNNRKLYLTDLLFALKMYPIVQKRGMDIRLASYDNVWIYLCMKVVPEIVFERFGLKKDEETGLTIIPVDHLYKKSMRIYLKSLWWYLFLSMRVTEDGKDNLEETRQMLWDKNTDTILQLVERSGREGYRVDLYREIIGYYCYHQELTADDFRCALILNTASCQVIEPSFSSGGVQEFVKGLFRHREP